MPDATILPSNATSPVHFEILGDPSPQGSKSRMPNGAIIEGATAGQRAKHKAWRSAVADTARDVAGWYDGAAPLDGALHLIVEFRFPMPASRPKRVQAARIAPKSTAPDLDKLIRALGDGLTAGGLIRDDARLSRITASKVEVSGWTGATVSLIPEATP